MLFKFLAQLVSAAFCASLLASAAPTEAADTSAAASACPDLQRVSFFIKKRPDLTYDQFYDYWFNKHAPKVAPWVISKGFTNYRQVTQCSFEAFPCHWVLTELRSIRGRKSGRSTAPPRSRTMELSSSI